MTNENAYVFFFATLATIATVCGGGFLWTVIYDKLKGR